MSGKQHPQLQNVWRDSGRPGVDLLVQAMRRKGFKVTRTEAAQFVKGQTGKQLFRPPARSIGKVTALRAGFKWQADLIDFTSRDPSKNRGYRYVLVLVDVFTRLVQAEPMRGKKAADTVSAFEAILNNSGTKPAILDTDVGGEFEGIFEKRLRDLHIIHVQKDPRHKDAIAVVDAAIARIKQAVAQELVETGSESWIDALPRAIGALNTRPSAHLLGSAPDDVEDNAPLNYALEARAGEDVLANSKQLTRATKMLLDAGAYRVLLPRREWQRTDQPKYSSEVHEVQSIKNGYVFSKSGLRHQIRFAAPVPKDSQTIRVPRAIMPGDAARDDARREVLKPFIEALKGHLGGGSATLMQAGMFLSKVPGYTDAMKNLKLHDAGFRVVAALFDDLDVFGGEGAQTRVKVTPKKNASTAKNL